MRDHSRNRQRLVRRVLARCMRFNWGPIKAAVNRDKHGVTFEEACTCFNDSWHVVLFDPDHSDDEDRELLIGHSSNGRLLIVSYTLRGTENPHHLSPSRYAARSHYLCARNMIFVRSR